MNARSAVLLVALIASSVACQGHEPARVAEASDKGPQAPVARDEGPRKVFEHWRYTEVETLDPPRQFDTVSAEIVEQVYDGLLTYHYLKRPLALSPNLLAAMPTLSEDGLTYSFELRRGVMFPDDWCFKGGKGRELVADDVLYAIRRFADAKVNRGSYTVLLGDRIVGLDAYRDRSRSEARMDHAKGQVEGLEKTGTHTFTITLTRPDPKVLMSLAATSLSIYPKEAVINYGSKFGRHPVGTGPFRLKSYPTEGPVVFVRNPAYHLRYPDEGEPGDEAAGLLEDAGKRLPLVDELRIVKVAAQRPVMTRFLAGELDWVPVGSDDISEVFVAGSEGFQLKTEHEGRFDVHQSDTMLLEYWVFNMEDPLLGKNKVLRQALALALDIPGFVAQMRRGRSRPLRTLVPPGISGSERELDLDFYETNIEAARAKLAEAGFPNGEGLPEFVVEIGSTGASMRAEFEFHRAQVAKAGIRLRGNFRTFRPSLKKIVAGEFQVAQVSWIADYPDPENFYQLLYSPNKRPGPNKSFYQNPDYDRLYEQMRAMDPGAARHAIITKMAAIIKEDAPLIPVTTTLTVELTPKWVGNMKRNTMLGLPIKYLDIDPVSKAREQGEPEGE